MKSLQLQQTGRTCAPVAVFVLSLALALTALALCSCGKQAKEQDPVVMVINGEKVTNRQISEGVDVLRSPEMNPSPELILGGDEALRREAARVMSGNILMLSEVRARGWQADTAVVNIMASRFISQFPSREDFEAQLAAIGESEASIRKGMAEEILLDSLIRTVSAGAPPVDSAAIRSRYEANKGRYVVPARVRASQIVFALQPTASDSLVREVMLRANEVRAKALAGEDFEKLAAAYSSLPKDSDMGWFAQGELVPDLERTLFAMKAGEVSAPVPSGRGIHIFKKTGEEEPRPMSFEEARAGISASLEINGQAEIARRYIDSLTLAASIEFFDPALDFRAGMKRAETKSATAAQAAGDTPDIAGTR
ncbi:MAG: peptidylprolyl isomerase [Chitinispirillia bacterium]|nr:peptidylprolyl isomerase [Chitinispirillia bacterium]MCL2242688.1 peptidylprolyl isomerase [Chitinispirillia bacterium]